MITTRLTVKNYRGFSDQNPATIEFGTGLTALLGPNNAGKSSLKLLIYEMRSLFDVLARVDLSPNLVTASNGGRFSISSYPGTSDPEEVFNNTNDRGISLEIEAVGVRAHERASHTVSKVVANCSRNSPLEWEVQVFSIEGGTSPVTSPSGYNHLGGDIYSAPGGVGRFDFSQVLKILRMLLGAKYYGPFRNAINQGSAQHFDLLIGTAFIDLWNTWKTSGNKAQSRAIGRITDEIRRLFEFDQLEINASEKLKTLLVSINKQPYRLGELGAGISQFIIALGNAATARPSLILVDEPETNLHPALQIDFLLALAQYATVGCVFSTHSVGLARSVAERIYSVQKSAAGPLVRPFEATPSYSQFLGELSFSSFQEMGCSRVLLVEGVNDVKTVQQFLRLFGKEHMVVIVPLGGDQMVTGKRELELLELRRITNELFALIDSERPASTSPAADRRVQFEELCRTNSIQVCLTEFRALENYLPDRAVKAALGTSFSQLAPYERMDQHSNGWSKADSWRIARHMTREELLATDVGQFLDRI